jgi:hypothetical protein
VASVLPPRAAPKPAPTAAPAVVPITVPLVCLEVPCQLAQEVIVIKQTMDTIREKSFLRFKDVFMMEIPPFFVG